jgi:hypothetical protein
VYQVHKYKTIFKTAVIEYDKKGQSLVKAVGWLALLG